MRPRLMIGEEYPEPRPVAVQRTVGPPAGQERRRPVSGEIPSLFAPRHWDQPGSLDATMRSVASSSPPEAAGERTTSRASGEIRQAFMTVADCDREASALASVAQGGRGATAG